MVVASAGYLRIKVINLPLLECLCIYSYGNVILATPFLPQTSSDGVTLQCRHSKLSGTKWAHFPYLSDG